MIELLSVCILFVIESIQCIVNIFDELVKSVQYKIFDLEIKIVSFVK